MATKVRKRLTLDRDVVAAFADDPRPFSVLVDELLQAELDRRDALSAGVGDFDFSVP